jgi:hypothetical protein
LNSAFQLILKAAGGPALPDIVLIGSSKIDNGHEDDDSYPDPGASEHSQKQIMNHARPIVPLIPNGAPGASA